MEQTTGQFSLPTLVRKKIEKFRHKERDVRIHHRLSALLWLADGYSVEEVAALLGVCSRTVKNWLALYQKDGLDALCSLQYKGDPGGRVRLLYSSGFPEKSGLSVSWPPSTS